MLRRLYHGLAKPIFFRLHPDRAHAMVSAGLRVAGSTRPTKALTRAMLRYDDPILESTVCGIRFPLPFGLSAGFDANGRQASVYAAAGFGFAEIGSVTRHAQPGNPPPHYARLVEDQGLVVHKGLKNNGVEHVVAHLQRLREKGRIDYPLGVSIARTTDIPDDQTVEDYAASVAIALPVADYITLNVSCPNVACFTPEKQVAYTEGILRRANEMREAAGSRVPLWSKFGPDHTAEWNERIIDICLREGADAIALTNLVKDRTKLTFASTKGMEHPGGISGKLLAPFARRTLQSFATRLHGRIPLVAIGGIFTANDAYERIRLGASLLQGITGWIFEGPTMMRDVHTGLAALLRRDGFAHLHEAIGADLPRER